MGKNRNKGGAGKGEGDRSSSPVEMRQVNEGKAAGEEKRDLERQGRESKKKRARSARSSESDSEVESELMLSEEEGGVESDNGAGGHRRLNVVVRFAGEGGVARMNPLQLTRELNKKCGDIKFAKVLKDGNLIIGCTDEIQMALVKQFTMVGDKKVVKVVQIGEQRSISTKGVITGVAVEVEEGELKENLRARGIEIMNVKRMTKGPEKEISQTVLIEFKGEVIPDRVYVGFMCFYVRAYIPKPMRCFNCQKFGHIAKFCKEKRRCARCTGDHEYGDCGEETKLKCCSCGGEHSVTFGKCPTMKKEVEVQKVKVLDKVTYAQALKKVEKREETHRVLAGGEVRRREPREQLREQPHTQRQNVGR